MVTVFKLDDAQDGHSLDRDRDGHRTEPRRDADAILMFN